MRCAFKSPPTASLTFKRTCLLNSALAAIHKPNLFSSLIAIDPVITKPLWPDEHSASRAHTRGLSLAALTRRDGWSSRYLHTALPPHLFSPPADQKHSHSSRKAPSFPPGTPKSSESTSNAAYTRLHHNQQSNSKCHPSTSPLYLTRLRAPRRRYLPTCTGWTTG